MANWSKLSIADTTHRASIQLQCEKYGIALVIGGAPLACSWQAVAQPPEVFKPSLKEQIRAVLTWVWTKERAMAGSRTRVNCLEGNYLNR